MAGIDYTTAGLIEAIKRDDLLPDSQSLYLPADIVAILTDELLSVIVPLIMSVKEEYLVVSYDQAIASGQRSFFINPLAVGLKLRDVVLVNANDIEIPVDRYEPEDLKRGIVFGTYPAGFVVDNDKINLIPKDTDFSGFTLRQKIFRRPNNLVLTSQAAQITSLDRVLKQVTCSTMPSIFTTSLIYDFIKGTPSFRAHAEAQVCTNVTGFTMTFTEDLPDDLAVGDWIAESGFSPIAQIPYELHKLLQQRGIIKILEGLKDANGLKLALEGYNAMVEKFSQLMAPRVDGSPQKLVSRRNIRTYGRSGPWYR